MLGTNGGGFYNANSSHPLTSPNGLSNLFTIYLLSADNLTGRSPEELAQLFEIIADLADDLSRNADWRIQHVGTSDALPPELTATLKAAEARTAQNTGLHVNLAIGYGGRREIADAMRSIVRDHGGWIDVESTRVVGTVFTVYLPG